LHHIRIAALVAAAVLLTSGANVAGAQSAAADRVQVVEVSTPSNAAKNRLQRLGLDLTEHGDRNSLEVVLHDAEDARRLRAAGFSYRVRIADLAAQTERDREADARYAAETPRSDLPSGRTSYRTLDDYEAELTSLAQRYPSLVRPITLPYRTHEGRTVRGIEITRAASSTSDGRPIFLQMGAHHAREWPSAEHAMEFAYDLLTGYGSDARTTSLVDRTRTIVIPVVNPDGFNISRNARPGDPADDFGLFDYEMKRKNCRPDPNFPSRRCDANKTIGRLQGVDPNRNYGGLWGGPGAQVSSYGDTFRGPEPFSEPETQNIRWLHSTRTVTTLISNHTYSNLVLRPPGTIDIGTPVDDPQMKALGGTMASRNGYANIPSYGLYETTGGTEDWTYWSAGSLGYTFEIGDVGFHPPYEDAVVGEYLGRAPAAGAGRGGNREAYFDMLAATADTATHSVITGKAPPGAKLTLSKSFMTQTNDPRWLNDFGTSLAEPLEFPDTLKYELQPSGESFEWHVTPSTRPIVAGRIGREPVADPQASITLANPDGIPAQNPYSASYEEGEYETIPFTVQGPPAVDNGRMTVHIEWADPNVDWDLYVLGPDGNVVAQSAAFGDADEDAALLDPPPGDYTAVVVNYDQAGRPQDQWDDWTNGTVEFRSPDPSVAGVTEAWTLTCSSGGTESTRQVVVARGERVGVGQACQKSKPRAGS
jgi:Zinc carboxypeptidase